MVIIVIAIGGAIAPRPLARNHPSFEIPWGKTWKNRTRIESSLCVHSVNKNDFIGFKDFVAELCRTKKNIFRAKQKSVPRAVTRHLIDWDMSQIETRL